MDVWMGDGGTLERLTGFCRGRWGGANAVDGDVGAWPCMVIHDVGGSRCGW